MFSEWSEVKPRHPALRRWIRRFLFRRDDISLKSARYLVEPGPGVSIFIDFTTRFSKDGERMNQGLRGLHRNHFFLQQHRFSKMDQMIVEFAPSGISLFTDHPVSLFYERLIPLHALFSNFSSDPFERMVEMSNVDRALALEAFLLSRFREPNWKDELVDSIAVGIVHRNRFQSGEAIARIASLSERQIERLFLASVGVSRREFHTLVRFSKAGDLLKSSTTPLADIALECGYYDQSQLSRDFATRAGISPYDYRKGISLCRTIS